MAPPRPKTGAWNPALSLVHAHRHFWIAAMHDLFLNSIQELKVGPSTSKSWIRLEFNVKKHTIHLSRSSVFRELMGFPMITLTDIFGMRYISKSSSIFNIRLMIRVLAFALDCSILESGVQAR